MVTVSFILVAQEWGNENRASLSHTHAQQADVHAFDQVTLANIRVICPRPAMAAADKQDNKQNLLSGDGLTQSYANTRSCLHIIY